MKKGKEKLYLIIALTVLIIALIGGTFAYFQAQGNNGASREIIVSSGTTDTLSFTIDKDINIIANTNNFYEDAGDLTDTATLTAILRPNSGNGHATNTYNVFFIMDYNDLGYTTQAETPELVLEVTDPLGNKMTRITSLEGTNGVFDITGRRVAITIATDYPIEANNGITATQVWEVDVTLVNLENDQNANTGKQVTGMLYLTKEELSVYALPEINSLDIIDTNGGSTVTENSITVTLNTSDNTEEIDKYYYAIEEVQNPTAYYGGLLRLGSIKKLAVELSDYIESDSNTHTFTGLTSNTNYRVYAYARDIKGFKSNFYSTVVKTTTDVPPRVTGVEIHKDTDSITIDVTTTEGDNDIEKVYYSIDGGSTWVEITDNHAVIEDLNPGRDYNVLIKVEDEEGLVSPVYVEQVTTEPYIEPEVVTTSIETTEDSITIIVVSEEGTSEIDTYYYSIDGGETWVEGTDTKTFNNLVEDQEYTILIKIVDDNGQESEINEIVVTPTDYTLPSITNVSVRPLPTSLTIMATGVEGTNEIAKYYYSIQDGRNYVESNSSTYTFDNISSNTVFNIKVYAEDTTGKVSPVYATSSKTEYVNPSIRTITKTVGTNGVTLLVDGQKGSNEIDKYYYKLKSTNEWIASVTNEIIITGLTSDTTYEYEVKLVDTDEHESSIQEITVHTNYIDPVVDSITVVSRTWDSITVRATATAGSHPISKYYFKTDQTSYVESNSNEYTFTGLNDGNNAAINYEIAVYVIDNVYQNGDTNGKSDVTKVNTATLAYVEPTISVTSSKTASSITLNATAVKGDGNILKYSYSNDNGTTWIEHNSSSLSDTYTFTGLNDYTDYNIKVKVTDVNNRTDEYTETIKTDYIEPVINGITNSKTWNSITLTVNATAGTTPIDKYYFRTASGSYDSGQASNEKTYTGLTEDTSYTYYVKLVDTAGHEVTEQQVTVTTNDYNEPTLALNGAIQTTYNTVTVNVTGAANETGATIVSYSFKIDSETPVVVNSSSTSASHTFNVVEDQTHSIEVNMTDSFGRVSTVTSSGIATPAYIPPTITSVTASNETINTVKLTIVASDGQNTIKGYKVSTDGGLTYGSLISTTSHNYEYTITGLTDNTNYSIKVKTVDTIDRESTAGSTSTSTLYKEPTVSCSPSNPAWNSLVINATGVAGSTAISTYNFKKGSEGYKGAQASNSYTFTSLDQATQYTFTVQVTDTAGHTATGTCSGTTSVYNNVVINDITTSNITYDSARITVSATPGTGSISRYEYKLSSSGTWINNGSSNIINLSNLVLNTDYTYNIRVKDSNNRYSDINNITLRTASDFSGYLVSLYNKNGEGTDGLYYHDGVGTYGTYEIGDNSYRYSGSNPPNYVCFGPGATNTGTCPTENLYRVVGVFDNKVKLIKFDYATTDMLGIDDAYKESITPDSNYTKGVLTSIPLYFPGSYRMGNYTCNPDTGDLSGVFNYWVNCSINTVNLNTNYLTYLTTTWSNLIYDNTWIVGGYLDQQFYNNKTLKNIYDMEITNTGTTGQYVNANYNTYGPSKVGLIYMSDYYYTSNASLWNTIITVSTAANIVADAWIRMGVRERTITRDTRNQTAFIVLSYDGRTAGGLYGGIRPVFYLKSDTALKGQHTGTSSDPYRIETSNVVLSPPTLNSVSATTIDTRTVTLTANATLGSSSNINYQYKLSSSSSWISAGSSNSIVIKSLQPGTTYTYNVRVRDEYAQISTTKTVTFTTNYDISLQVSNLPTTYGKTVTPSCSGASVVWNQAYQRIEVSNYSAMTDCSLNYTNPSGTTLLSDYVTGLNNTTQGDGKVINENGYRYEGKNPNNYIWFNNELWRIIGVFSDIDEQPLVKIIRNQSIGAIPYDTSGSTSWRSSFNNYHIVSLKYLLNDTYYNHSTTSTNCYGYCDFTIKGIQAGYQGMIEQVAWPLGRSATSITASEAYSNETDSSIYSNEYYAIEKIGLMSESDYLYASLATNCPRTTVNRSSYVSTSSYSLNSTNCAKNNWLYGQGNEWTMTPASDSAAVFINHDTNTLTNGATAASNTISYFEVRPTLYLNAAVYKISGTGTKANPYIIGM